MVAPNYEGRRVRALAAITTFIPRVGMVVMDPESKDENKRFPFLPEASIEQLVREKRVVDDYVEAAPAEPVAKTGKKAKAAPAEPAADEGEPAPEEAPPA